MAPSSLKNTFYNVHHYNLRGPWEYTLKINGQGSLFSREMFFKRSTILEIFVLGNIQENFTIINLKVLKNISKNPRLWLF